MIMGINDLPVDAFSIVLYKNLTVYLESIFEKRDTYVLKDTRSVFFVRDINRIWKEEGIKCVPVFMVRDPSGFMASCMKEYPNSTEAEHYWWYVKRINAYSASRDIFVGCLPYDHLTNSGDLVKKLVGRQLARVITKNWRKIWPIQNKKTVGEKISNFEQFEQVLLQPNGDQIDEFNTLQVIARWQYRSHKKRVEYASDEKGQDAKTSIEIPDPNRSYKMRVEYSFDEKGQDAETSMEIPDPIRKISYNFSDHLDKSAALLVKTKKLNRMQKRYGFDGYGDEFRSKLIKRIPSVQMLPKFLRRSTQTNVLVYVYRKLWWSILTCIWVWVDSIIQLFD